MGSGGRVNSQDVGSTANYLAR